MGEASLQTRAPRRSFSRRRLLALCASFAVVLTTLVGAPLPALGETEDAALATPLAGASAPAPLTNPNMAPACGIDLTVILDESGSIGNAGAENDVRDATLALLNGLNNTGSRVNFVEFATEARLANPGGGGTGYRAVNAALIADVTSYFAGTGNSSSTYQPDGWTNWDDAWFQSWQHNQASPPDLAIFLTDGNPNTVIGGSGGGTSGDAAAAATIDDTNAYKAAGTHLLGIAVGNVTLSTIQTVTGPDTWSGSGSLDLRTTDVIVVSSFSDLDDALRQVVYALCSPSVTLNKHVIDGSQALTAGGAGWGFTGTVTVADGPYEWTNPAAGISPPATNMQPQTTGGGGFATFQWTPGSVDDPEPWVSTFSYEETASPDGRDFVFLEGMCDVERLNDDGSVTIISDVSLAPGHTLAVEKSDIVTCDIVNALVDLSVEKTFEGYSDNGDGTFTVEYRLDVTNDSDHLGTTYTLMDTASLTDGVVVLGVSLNNGPVVPGAGPWTLAIDRTIDPGVRHSHAVDLLVASAYPEPYTACNGTSGRGLYNAATLTFPGGSDAAWDCGDFAAITIEKEVINNDGGTATAHDFVLRLDGRPVAPGVPTIVEPGVHGISEDDPGPSYVQTGDNCNGEVGVEPGEQATCVITNDDVGGTLTLEKVVVNNSGGDADPSEWDLYAAGPVNLSGPGGFGPTAVPAGDYTLSETGPDGYTASSWTCDGTPLFEGVVSVGLAEAVFCSITNDDAPATLTLVKRVMNDDGGVADAADWLLEASGPTPLSGAGLVSGLVHAGLYTLSESGPRGYTPSEWDCDGGIFDPATNQLAIGLEEDVTCMIVNDDEPASITLHKRVLNHNGGAAQPADFELVVVGVGSFSTGQTVVVDANATYRVTEVPVAGYQVVEVTCGEDTIFGPAIDVTPVSGEAIACTFTNTDIAPTLTLEKAVINNDGGTASPASSWGLMVQGNGAPMPVVDGQSIVATAGVAYVFFEGDPRPQYAQVGPPLCVDDLTQQAVAHPVVMELDQAVTCIITNDDVPARLELVKIVITDDGGDETAADWRVAANGPELLSGWGGAAGAVPAGTYALSESWVPGYTAGPWTCDGAEVADGDQITLDNGDVVTCTIINDDQPAVVIVEKVVINDDGGDAIPADFVLRIDGAATPSGIGVVVAANETYTISEDPLEGYAQVSLLCFDEEGAHGLESGSQVTHPVTPAEGQFIRCVVTNDDLAPGLTIFKEVINDGGGTLTEADFPLFITPDDGDPQAVQHGQANRVRANTLYTVSETQQGGYDLASILCNGEPINTIELAEGESKACVVTNDDNDPEIVVVKEVINDAGGTSVVEDFSLTITRDGGDPEIVTAGEPTIVFAGVAYTVGEVTEAGYEQVEVICEWVDDEVPFLRANPVTLELGEQVLCTVVNDDIAPTLAVAVEVNSGSAEPDDFDPTVTGDFEESAEVSLLRGIDLPIVAAHVVLTVHPGSGEPVEVIAGHPYTTAIVLMEGYVQVGEPVCQDELTGDPVGHPIVPLLGQEIACVYQVEMLPLITVIKESIPGGGEFAFTLDPTDGEIESSTVTVAGDGGTHTWQYVLPGLYDLTEETPVDWTLETVACDDLDAQILGNGARLAVGYGDEVTCTFTNGELPTVTVIKVTDVPTDDTFSFTLNDGDPVVLGSGSSETWTLGIGQYTLLELASEGWTLEGAACDGEFEAVEDGVAVELAFGDAVICTFSNLLEVADLMVTKTDVADPIFINDEDRIGTIVYQLAIVNSGPGNATGVTIVDVLDPTTSFVSATPSKGTCSHAAGTITCVLGDLAVEASASVTIMAATLDVEAVIDVVVDNRVTVAGDQTDPDLTNNVAVEDTTIVPVLQEIILPETGMNTGPIAAGALVFLLFGAALLWLGKSADRSVARRPQGEPM